MPRSDKTRAWRRKRAADSYASEARRAGYRSRAAYKLLELDAKHKFLRPGLAVLELGAAPGGWTQVVAAKVGPAGAVVAVDRLKMPPVEGARIITADLALPGAAAKVAAAAGRDDFDLVISDAAPNITGVKDVDDQNFADLAATIADIHRLALRPGGRAVTKFFQGSALDEAADMQRGLFKKVVIARPGATKKASREVYLISNCRLPAQDGTNG